MKGPPGGWLPDWYRRAVPAWWSGSRRARWLAHHLKPHKVIHALGTNSILGGTPTIVERIQVFPGEANASDFSEAIGGLRSALKLIARYDARQMRRILDDGVRIVFTRTIGGTQYWGIANAIALELRVAKTLPPVDLARYIVHEATHARIERQGIWTRRNDIVTRIERRCVEEEIAFIGRLPRNSDDAYRQWAAGRREQVKTQWWSPTKRRQRMLAALEREGELKWLTRLVRLFVKSDPTIE